ncbi:hypothetical protein QBC34DRAFT_416455 [Podospora aff. communis PSN243]|uniref:Peptidase S8/S53 domain-containing protein n=1 Tax=Podospora aff. communis PSN243 TaxID=3040156 RepID=A0AAV9G5L2_9PEZI|nr:hypothetical protein QBC34DRAFT_416455 [Podospora aff. communis PSN243]
MLVKMHLAEEDAHLFLAVVPAFVAALPPSPNREIGDLNPRATQTRHASAQSEDWNRTKRHNAITFMRFEVQDLAVVLTKDLAQLELLDDALEKASDALEDLLDLLDRLVDDGILRSEGLPKDPPSRFPRLWALETLLQPCGHVPATDVPSNLPGEVLSWIKYPAEGAEALKYRKIAYRAQQFNNTMRGIYEFHSADSELELTQVEATQIFHPSRQSPGDASDDIRASADLKQAQILCESATTLAEVFKATPRPCEPPHSAHIHLSGFEQSEVEMLVSVCGEAKAKWHIVHWTNPSSTCPAYRQEHPTGSICSLLKESRTVKKRLRIQLEGSGCWKCWSAGPGDRIMKYAVAPKKTLDEWLFLRKDREAALVTSPRLTRKNKLRLALKIAKSLLCLLGSPLLQGPWKSQSILIAEINDDSLDPGLQIKPYIVGELTRCFGKQESQKSDGAQSSILHLGLLLWEVFLEEKVTITDEDREEAEEDDEDEDEDDINSLFNALNRKEIDSRESSFIDTFCLDLIANCLNLYGQASVVDAAFRAKLYWDVVKPLLRSVEDYTPSKLKPNTTMTSRPAPPSLRPITSTEGFSQPKFLAMKLGRDATQRHVPSNPPRSANFGRGEHNQRKPHSWLKKCILFDADDETYTERTHPDTDTEDFIHRMDDFVGTYIQPLPEALADNISLERLRRSIRIAVLDTGIHIDKGDEILDGGQDRIIQKRNFLGADEHAYVDSYGHGTHVVRLLLRFAPFANIIVAKISESKYLAEGDQIAKALDWVSGPDCNADIIVMSFGLGPNPDTEVKTSIEALVAKGKLIFAAASNSGGNEPRAFPANQDGVFCIHVSDGKGNKAGINPAPAGIDNFSTLGNAIESKWGGKELYITGSSFAAPIAAGIAANALEYIRHFLTEKGDHPDYFYRYQGMCALFQCLSDGIDGYDYVKPWKRHLWDGETGHRDICAALRALEIHGPKWWIKRTSEDSFSGF